MKMFNTKFELENELITLDVADSLSICFIHGSLDAQSIIAIRNADRLCDRVVAVNLSKTPISKVQTSLIQRAGASYIYECDKTQAYKCNVNAGIEGINATFIMQALISIMPLTVTVAENNTHLIKAIKNIQQTFGAFFTFEIKATPVDLLSVAHKKLREALTPVLLNIQNGESDADVLNSMCISALKGAGFKINSLEFIDSDTLETHVGVISPTSLLLINAALNGQLVRDILSLIEK